MTTVTVPTGGSPNAVVLYLRATTNANLTGGNPGTYYGVMLAHFSCQGMVCSAGVYVYESVAGTVTNLTSCTVPVHNNSVFRAMVHATSGAVYVDNTLYQLFTANAITQGAPGIGAVGGVSGLAAAALGQIDNVAPNAVLSTSVQTSSVPNRIDLHWAGASDNSGGIGVAYYDVYRSNSDGSGFAWISHFATPEISDLAVAPGTSYIYTIVPVDFHLNGCHRVVRGNAKRYYD